MLNTDGEYVPLSIGPDSARDARVAARRAEDARKAAGALDRILTDEYRLAAYRAGYSNGWQDGYTASQEHHNCHYGAPGPENVCGRFVPFDPGAPEHGTCGGCGARFAQHKPNYGVPCPHDCGHTDCPTHAGGSS